MWAVLRYYRLAVACRRGLRQLQVVRDIFPGSPMPVADPHRYLRPVFPVPAPGIALAVKTPPTAAGLDGSLNTGSASKVVGAPPVTGLTPL